MRGWWVGIAEMLLAHAALSSGVGRALIGGENGQRTRLRFLTVRIAYRSPLSFALVLSFGRGPLRLFV
jgi:hypothetical protein